MSPPGVIGPTRVPKAGTFGVGASAEAVFVSGRSNLASQPYSLNPVWWPKVHGWASYSLTNRFAVSVVARLPIFPAGAYAGAHWVPLQTRYVDLALQTRVGLAACFDLRGWGEADFCSRGYGPAREFYGTGSSVALMGINPARWLTLQVQGGGWMQRGFDWRAGPWVGGAIHVMPTAEVGIGVDLMVLPRWFPDGRALVQPALSLVFWPKRGSNPYWN